MSEKNGGPAFPEVFTEGNRMTLLHGMSLRDWYAGKFAAVWVLALSTRSTSHGYTDESAAFEANKLGLLQADAMIAEREKERKK